MEKVSIVTPSFNVSTTISLTIESVQNQSYQNWELIIVDDNSTDLSAEIVEVASKADPRIKLIRLSKNSGPAVARNTAIRISNGRYIAFLDADDLWSPKKLEKQINFMRSKNIPFSFTWYQVIDCFGHFLREVKCSDLEISYNQLLRSNEIGCLTAVYDTKIIGKRFMPLVRKRQDYGLWLNILKSGNSAVCLPEVLASYRLVSDSISSNKFSLIKHNWRLFRDVEGFGHLISIYYILWNIYRKFIK